jgi:hypothetical protein
MPLAKALKSSVNCALRAEIEPSGEEREANRIVMFEGYKGPAGRSVNPVSV